MNLGLRISIEIYVDGKKQADFVEHIPIIGLLE